MSTPSIKRDRPQSETQSPASSSISSPLPLPKFLAHPLPTLHQKFKSINAHDLFLRQAAAASAEAGDDNWPAQPHARNRYADIYPWAHNAVQLRCLEDPYINASPIALGRRGERFIATQGPLDEDGGEVHFWEMVWQEGCGVVVMLTQPWEDGREKCSVYYPETEGEVKDLEGWGRVECVRIREEERTEVRELRVWKGLDRAEREEEEKDGEEGEDKEREDSEAREAEYRTVWHFLFLGWPDHDIPLSATDQNALLELMRMSRSTMERGVEQRTSGTDETEEETTPPRLVHCSAGVGRTGTFIALDHLLHELKDGKFDCLAEDCDGSVFDYDEDDTAYSEPESEDPVYDTVLSLREQRMFMVGKPKQYAFIYQMLREIWEAREKGEQVPSIGGHSNGEESQTKKRRLAQDGSEDELSTDDEGSPRLN